MGLWRTILAVHAFALACGLLAGCGDDGHGATDDGDILSDGATDDSSTSDTENGATDDGDILSDGATDDSSTSDTANDATDDNGQPANGLGSPCASTSACASGLTCIETNAATGDGICTRTCAVNSDCPSGGYCHIVGKQLACTLAGLCDPCQAASDCGTDNPLCVPGADGKTFCTVPCAFGDKSCQPGYSCEQYGSTINDFACRPDYGACAGGGDVCAPCQSASDCKSGTQCATSPDTGERACFQTCSKDADCATGFGCSPKGICSRLVPSAGKPPTLVQTCAKDNRGYCDPCTADWQCASNRCRDSQGQSFCAEPTPCVKSNETKDCAPGTFCVPSATADMICAPPISWKCQGYKACFENPCSSTEVCSNGLCKPK